MKGLRLVGLLSRMSSFDEPSISYFISHYGAHTSKKKANSLAGAPSKSAATPSKRQQLEKIAIGASPMPH